MKTITHSGSRFILRLDPGEELFQSLADFAKNTGIRSAGFCVIGSAKEVVLSWYNLSEKRYEDTVITEELEVLGVTGNLGMFENTIAIHAHGTIGDRNLIVRGGHIKKLVVLATCEVDLVLIEGTLEREHDEATGLNLLI